jgi:ABC-2 type transport system permease protein/lipopolysaccharide transport system permease protein
MSLRRDFKEFWADREMILSLAIRDIKSRYVQSYLGIAWAIITPLLTVFVFGFFFKKIGHLSTPGAPYYLQVYCGLLPWQFFTSAVGSAAGALVANNMILNKMKCAREVFPIEQIGTSLFDMCLASIPFALLFVRYQFMPKPTTWWVIPLFGLQMMFTIGLGLAMSTTVIYLRDVSQILGSILTAGLYLSPVAYPVSAIPEQWRVPLSIINPFVALIDGYRRAILFNKPPDFHLLLPASITCLVTFVFGYIIFRRTETGIADIA